MKAFNIMTTNLVAAREGTTAREIGTKLLIGNFNGLPVIVSSIKVMLAHRMQFWGC
jgi:CBS domain-containing protein